MRSLLFCCLLVGACATRQNPGDGETAASCAIDGKKLEPWHMFKRAGEVCGCASGVVSCRGAGATTCFANGVWHDSGARVPNIDGCNSALCQNGEWTAMTLLSCELAIADQVLFDAGSAEITDAHAAMLEDLANTLVANPAVRVAVVGHADASEADADELAEQRARAVIEQLIGHGVPGERLERRAMGSSQPLAPPGGAPAKNRRVDFDLTAH